MWLDELRWLEELVSKPDGAPEVFDSLKYDQSGSTEDRLAALAIDYERLASIANPSRAQGAPAAKELAERVLARLNTLYQEATALITGGALGSFQVQYRTDPYRSASPTPVKRGLFTVDTQKGSFRAEVSSARGDLAQIFTGECTHGDYAGEPVVLKIAFDRADNDLIVDEGRALRLFEATKAAQLKQLPVLLDQFQTKDGRAGNILRLVEGVDGITIREKYKDGVPAQHVIWMIRRLLSVLGFAHSQGVLHGNIEPSHIMIRPHDHNVTLLDWCYSVVAPAKTGQRFKCFNPEYSAPEIPEKKPPLPSSDLYSVGKCMIYLLGGDIRTDTLPGSIDERLQRFVKYFVRTSALQRAQDAWEMYEELGKIRKALYGQHKFEVFEV